jgi:hypothetical protein
MIWSLVPIALQDGIVFQAGAADGSLSAPSAPGRWVAKTSFLSSALSPDANEVKTVERLRYTSASGVGGSVAGTRSNTVAGSTASAESGPESWNGVSPVSGAKELTYTRAFTFGSPVAALVITKPPYEWPTSTTGPVSVCRNVRTDAASLATDRSGLGMARTVYPSSCSRSVTPFQLEASAQEPCTSTMVGFAPR